MVARADRQIDVALRLRETAISRIMDRDFAGVDLRGADLSGIDLSFVSLVGAKLDGADLSGAQLRHVDMTGASLKEARLSSARLELVYAGSASFAGAHAVETRWEQTDLSGADLSTANLARSVIRGCTLESACLNEANLTQGSLAYSNCGGASFRGALLDRTNTVGACFVGTDFTSARKLFRCREIVVELLRREIYDDLERAKMVGAVAMSQKLCYYEWSRFLEFQPYYRLLALQIFEKYPESGVVEALRDGWRPPKVSRGTGKPKRASS